MTSVQYSFPRIPVYLNTCPQNRARRKCKCLGSALSPCRCSQPKVPPSLAQATYPTLLSTFIPGQNDHFSSLLDAGTPGAAKSRPPTPFHLYQGVPSQPTGILRQMLPALLTELPEHLGQAPQSGLQILGTECSLNAQISILQHNSLTHLKGSLCVAHLDI